MKHDFEKRKRRGGGGSQKEGVSDGHNLSDLPSQRITFVLVGAGVGVTARQELSLYRIAGQQKHGDTSSS